MPRHAHALPCAFVLDGCRAVSYRDIPARLGLWFSYVCPCLACIQTLCPTLRSIAKRCAVQGSYPCAPWQGPAHLAVPEQLLAESGGGHHDHLARQRLVLRRPAAQPPLIPCSIQSGSMALLRGCWPDKGHANTKQLWRHAPSQNGISAQHLGRGPAWHLALAGQRRTAQGSGYTSTQAGAP